MGRERLRLSRIVTPVKFIIVFLMYASLAVPLQRPTKTTFFRSIIRIIAKVRSSL